MREILFRGKRINGEWEFGSLSIRPNGEIEICNKCVDAPDSDPMWQKCLITHLVIPETVGQCTGLTDKNGTKIFEGDIVKTKKYGKIINHSNVNNYDIFEVIYEPAVFRLKNMYREFNLVGTGADYEVIGNIHDNPELLEVQE